MYSPFARSEVLRRRNGTIIDQLGNRIVWEIPAREIPGGKSREIRDRPVNTGKYKTNLLNGYFFPKKRVMKLKYQSLTLTPKNRV